MKNKSSPPEPQRNLDISMPNVTCAKDKLPPNKFEELSAKDLALLACTLGLAEHEWPDQVISTAMMIWQEAKKAVANPELYISSQSTSTVGPIVLGPDGKPTDNDCYFYILGDIPFEELANRKGVPSSRGDGFVESVNGIRKTVVKFFRASASDASAEARGDTNRLYA